MKRTLGAAALLAVVLFALTFVNDTRGFLGTDTGGKVATLQAMDGFDPDVGYWAEQWDPEGRLHPLYATLPLDGKWVQVTTIPALYAAYPLYQLGGYRLALLIPILGTVLAALGAAALARRLGADKATASAAFWVVGLASPLTIYALDFWEHSLGVACVVWALVLLVDVAALRVWGRALGAGALFGLAATMRTEAFVYGAVLTAATCLIVLVKRRDTWAAVASGLLVAAGLGAVLLANYGLEQATVGATLRSSRAATAADVAAGATTTGASRVEEALLTGLGLHPRLDAGSYLLGAALLALLLLAVLRGRSAEVGPARLALVGAAALYVLRASDGLGFVPGLVAAAPLAAAGVALGWDRRWPQRLPLVTVAALPLVWRLQFTGGAGPQWAGRYVLPTTIVLVAVAVARLGTVDVWVRRGLLTLSVAVTVFGVAWLSVRSHDVADTGAALARRPEPVLVSRIAHLFREEGRWYERDGRWLTVPTSAEEPLLAPLLQKAGVDRFAWVDFPGARPPVIDGFTRRGRTEVPFIAGEDLSVTTYARDG